MIGLRALASVASTSLIVSLVLLPPMTAPGLAAQDAPKPKQQQARTEQKSQTREHGKAVAVDPAIITVDDGDTVVIHWPGDEETVRILGIDTPETRHDEHNIPIDQAFGPEARTFAQGAFAVATEVHLVRASMLDPYGRTLGYLILNGKNYSVLVVKARLAEESVTFYGDNGLPQLAAEVMAAAKAAGPLPFEAPHAFRKRMRSLSDWQKAGQPVVPH